MRPRTGVAERVAWLGYIAIGLLATAYGAALPTLVRELGRGYAALSLLFVVFAAGNTVVYFFANPLVDRRGPQRILQIGLVLFLLSGGALVFAQTFSAWVAATLVAGIGFSLVDVAASRYVGALHSPQPAQALNRLNVFFGVGAIAAPLIVGLSVRLGGGPQPVFALVALAGAAGAIALARVPQPPPERAPHLGGQDSFLRFYGRTRWLQVLTAIVFFYIAAEVGFGAWISAYEHLTAGISTALSALYPAAYQIGLTLVRLFVGRALATLRLERLIAVGGVVAVLATLFVALGGANPWLAVVGALLAGVGFGPAFSAILAIASLRGPGKEGWTYGAVFSALALAALVAPWTEGQVFSRLPLLALLLTPLCALLMTGAAALLGWMPWQAEEGASGA